MSPLPMPDSRPLLIELFTEELPPKALRHLGQAFGDKLRAELAAHHLAAPDASLTVYAAPRHLGARIDPVRTEGEARQVRVKGPSVKVGLDDDGQPTMALRKWAEKQGVSIDALSREGEGKNEAFHAVRQEAGEKLAAVIESAVAAAVAALPVPKMMQYQLADGVTTVSFVRPAHRVVALHGAQVLPLTVLGLPADRVTGGHRFHATQPVTLPDADSYADALLGAHVIVGFDARRAQIDQQLRREADALSLALGDESDYAALLEEVTALVEWPAVYVGRFEADYLAVPPECLILTMRTNQKYFPLFAADGALSNHFLICSNMRIDDPSQIIDGNERVIRPRLADARFFFEQDRRRTLESRIPQLASVVYHAKLGSQADRSDRVAALAVAIATMLGHDGAAIARIGRAAQLAKTDLLTGMVGEFPELQGIMGTYYARHDGEPDDIAVALAEQYRPRFAGDALPSTTTGLVLALADKLETLAGLFSIGQLPTGDRDPFALRRHALGILRMLIEKSLPLSLPSLLEAAARPFAGGEQALDKLGDFLFERLVGYLREAGHSATVIAAVLALRPPQLDLVPLRLQAVAAFAEGPDAQALAAANKRIGNLLRKAEVDVSGQPDAALYESATEHQLADTLASVGPQVDTAMASHDYGQAMRAVAGMRGAVDAYFEQVMVMAEDPSVRRNRLQMLALLHHQMNRVADMSRLAT